jgi:hypothetical protein
VIPGPSLPPPVLLITPRAQVHDKKNRVRNLPEFPVFQGYAAGKTAFAPKNT